MREAFTEEDMVEKQILQQTVVELHWSNSVLTFFVTYKLILLNAQSLAAASVDITIQIILFLVSFSVSLCHLLHVKCSIFDACTYRKSYEPLRKKELAAGDSVKIELECEILKMMQEEHGGWSDVMIKVSQSYIKKIWKINRALLLSVQGCC